jgi:hypothetical protein
MGGIAVSRLKVSACAMAIARAVVVAAAENRWIATDLIKQPPLSQVARTVPEPNTAFTHLNWCILHQVKQE